MSDRTWNRLGRRRPYFLTGAILASVALFFMPDSSALWMAAGLLWILDASINISMEPFRAFVADKLNVEQRTAGFVMQSFFIGVGRLDGQCVALAVSSIWSDRDHSQRYSTNRPIFVSRLAQAPSCSPYCGRCCQRENILQKTWKSLSANAADLWQCYRTRQLLRVIGELFREISSAINEMPQTMKQLAVVQIFTWLGLFCMWMFFGLTTSYHVFGASSPETRAFALGQEWGGNAFAIYSIVCFAIAFLLPTRRSRYQP